MLTTCFDKMKIFMIIILIIGFFLRIYKLGAQSLWIDEVITINTAQMTPMAIISAHKSATIIHPSLFYILVHYWSYLGKSEFVLRLLSVLLGTYTIYLFFLLGKLLFNKNVGALSALILSISPFHIWYSQEIRPYALMILLSIIVVLFFLKIIKQNYWVFYLGYILTTVVGFYIHFYIILEIIFINLFLILTWKQHKYLLLKWIPCQIIIVLLYLPWVFVLLHAVEVRPCLRDIGLMVFPYTFFAFSAGFSLGPSIAELHVYNSIYQFLPYLWILVLFTIIFVIIFIIGLISLGEDKERLIFLLLYIGIPILGAFLISQYSNNVTYNVRYVCMSLPAYYLILAKGIYSIKRKGYMISLILLVILCNSFSLNNYYFNEKYAKEDSRSVTKYIETNAISNDVILITSPSLMVPFNYYYSGCLQKYSFTANQIFINSKTSKKAKQQLQKYRRI
ncbi:MAG: glycosyltransferase family 39 protein [bacterium]